MTHLEAPRDPAAPPGVRDAGTAAASQAVHCPLCEYDLRGLAEPRCPECGYRFAWDDLRDPSRRLHRYLFEHHPERNAWSFLRTIAGGWRPKRFWTSLLPAQPSRPRRLVAYWLATVSLLLPALAVHHYTWFLRAEAATRLDRARWHQMFPPGSPNAADVAERWGSTDAFLDQADPLPPSGEFYRRAWDAEGRWALYFAGVWVAWPWLTFLTLLLFRFSMRRARIKPVHVLRCVLYSADAMLLVSLAATAAAAARLWWQWLGVPAGVRLPAAPLPQNHPYLYRPDLVPDTLFWLGAAAQLFMAYRLTQAFRHYLRFDHPLATVLASQVIVLLLVWVWAVQTVMP